MNFRERINSVNSLEQYENEIVTWERIPVTTKTPPKQPQGRGEMPYQMEFPNNYSSGSSQSTPSSKKTFKNKKNTNTYQPSKHNRFAHIIPSVREANGGWNTQSNEAIERRFRERQQKFAEENIEQSNSDSCNATSSSESSESYKTTLQDSYEIKKFYYEQVTNNEQVTSETLTKFDLQRYKKNALMLGLLRSADNVDIEDDSTTESSEDYFDSNSVDDLASGVTNLNIGDEKVMQDERIGRLFQSQEDEDVYCHALQGQIQKDPEWQKLRLKRKGTETILSPRQFYLNIDDDEFTFESRKPK